MASGGVVTQSYDIRTLAMKGDKLTVQGTGITPRAATPSSLDRLVPGGGNPRNASSLNSTSSRLSSTSDDEVSQSLEDEEANSILRGVMDMNQVLEGQIDALRLRLRIEDKQHQAEQGRLAREKDEAILHRDTEIEDLKDSLVNRDDRIQTLVRASEEKDRTIQIKVSEIDDLKKMVKQTEEYAHKLHRQIGKVRHEKQTLETDTLYKEQNTEIARLAQELAELKRRLADMEQELQRAAAIIEQQTNKIRELEDERGAMHAKFREELDKATKAMRQEVERMREVMRQNYEEMRQLRDQNRQMHSDVRDIKDMLLKKHQQPQQQRLPSPRYEGTGIQRPLTASPVHMFKAVEYSSRTPALPKGGSNPRGPNQGVAHSPSPRVPSRAGGVGGGGPYSVRQSLEPPTSTTTRALSRAQPRKAPGPSEAGKGGGFPAVVTLKDEPGLPSIRVAPGSSLQRSKSARAPSFGPNKNANKK